MSAIGQTPQTRVLYDIDTASYTMVASRIDDLYALNAGFIFSRITPQNDHKCLNRSLFDPNSFFYNDPNHILDPDHVLHNENFYEEGGQASDDIIHVFMDSQDQKWLVLRNGLTKIDTEGNWINFGSVVNELAPDLTISDYYMDDKKGILLFGTNKGLMILKSIYLIEKLPGTSHKFIDIEGLIRDDDSVHGVTILVDDSNDNNIMEPRPAEVFGDYFTAGYIELADGWNEIKAIAEDVGGNLAHDTVTVFAGTRDGFIAQDSAYYLKIKDLTMTHEQDFVHISWDTLSSLSGLEIAGYDYLLDAIDANTSEAIDSNFHSIDATLEKGVTFDKSGLGSGYFKFSVRAVEAGNGLLSPWANVYFRIGAISVKILDENILPNDIDPDSYRAILNYRIDYDEAADSNITLSCQYKKEGGDWITLQPPSAGMILISPLTEGIYAVQLTAENTSGSSTDIRTFIIDRHAPAISIDKDIAYDLHNDTVGLSWAGTDLLMESIEYQYRLDNGSWSDWSKANSTQFDHIEPGVHTLSVMAKDRAYNISDPMALEFAVPYDSKTPPDVKVIEGPSGFINHNNVTFKWMGNDTITLPEEILFSHKLVRLEESWVYDAELDNEGYDFLIDWDNPAEADTAYYAYSWNNEEWIACHDTNTICVGERFNLSHPGVILGENLFAVRKEKEKEDSINSTQMKLFINPTENGEIRNRLIYKTTVIYSWSLWNNALSANFSGLRDGRYCFYIRGKDSSGNISDPVGIIFTIDTMPPAVNIINVSPGNIAPEVQIEVKDEKERPAEVRINGQVINELPVIVNPASIKIIARYYDIEQALINKAANNHIIVTVTDLAGNVSTCEHNLDPIEIYSPDPNTIVTNSPITISGRINIENPSEVQIKVRGEINWVDARIDASGKFMADGIEILSRADSSYENRIRIEVNDRYGHVITKSLKVFTKEGYLSKGVLLTTDPIDKNAGLALFAAKLIARIPSEKIKMGAQIGFEWDFDGDGRYEVSKIVTVFDNPDDIPYIEDSETFTYKTMGFYHPRVRVDLNLAEATSGQFTDSLRIIVYGQLKNVGSVHDIDSLILDTSVYKDAYGLRDLYVLSETIDQEYKIEIYEIEENALNWADGIYNLHFLYNIQRPTAIHVAPNKDIYIVDQEDTSVKKLIKSGQTYIYSKINLRKIKEDESEEPVNLMQPFDLTLNDHGDIFLSDQNTVYQFKSNGELVCKLDKFTTERGEEGFDRIAGIDFYAGYLWVIDQLKGQINKFIVRDNNLDYKSSWGASSNQETSLIHPFRSDFDKINGYIYIIDKGPDPNESFIKVYNSKGEFRFNIGDNFGISLNDPVSINLIGYSDTEKIFFIADNLKVDNKDTSEILSLQGDLLSMQDVTAPGGYLSHQKKIVFLRDGKLYVINDDGSDLRLIYTPGSLESSEGTLKIVDPSWYPDGTKIIFALYNMEKNISDLCIYDLTKDELITLWHTNSQVKNPSFNRNGDSIAFACNNTPFYEYDLFTLIYKDGKAEDLKNITNSDQREEAPCWSPDGARIAFISNQFTNKRIFTVDRDGMDEQCLIDDEDITCEQPAWSNENDLAFIKTYTNESQEWVTGLFYVKVNPDGTRTDDKFHEIKTDSINIKHPSWDASGERITYISNRNIKVHDIQKNETVQITYVYPKEDQSPSYSLDSVPYFQARAFEITQIDCSWEDNLGLSYKLAYNKGQTGDIFKSVGYMDSYSLLNLVPGNYELRIEGYDKYQKKVLSSITQKVRLSHVYGKVTITQDKSDSYSYIFDASESIGDNLEYTWEIDNGKYTERHPIFTYTYKNAYPVDENGDPIPDEVFLTVKNFNPSGELYEHRSGPYLIIIVEKDLEPVIDYELIDSNSGTIIRFDASKSKGSRIDQGWSWWCYGDGDCGISPTLSIDHKYPTIGNLQRYWVQVTIRRQGSLGDPSPDQASVEKYIDLEGDELKAVINYRFSETNPGQIIFDAGQSLGSDIVWSNCKWEFGGKSKYSPTVTWEYPADSNTVTYEAFLTIYRSSGKEQDTAVTYITIPGDPLEAVINYKFIDDFTILCEADNSIGRDIVWEHCAWETEDIIGPSIQRGRTATFAFPATSKDKSYPVTLTIYNSSGQSHSALETILINKDDLKAIVSYKESSEQPRTIIFDAGESLGSNIDWQRCKWSFGDQSVDYGPSAIHTYQSNRNTIRYPVTLTIFRKDTGEQDTSEVKYIAIAPDMPTAKIDYEFAYEMAPDGVGEGSVDLQTIICNAYQSSGNDILWNQCTWETIIANSIVKQTGPTATFKYPPETQSRYYPITLTVTDRSGQTDSVTEFIRVDEDYLNADFTYRFEDRLVDEQNDQETGHNVTFDARSSQGAGINWTACEWTFSDGYPKQHGACITRGFSYTSEDKDIALTLNIYRRGNEIEAASVTKHLKIIGDKLQAIIKWDVQEYTEGTEILEDGNIVSVTYIDTIILDAKSSIGHSINWDRCTWHFDNGQVKQGGTVSHRFAPGDTAYMHPVLLTIYRGTADGVESDSIYTNIFIKGDPLKPVIDYQFDTDIETAEGEQGKGSGRTVLFSARNSIGRGIVWDKCRWTFGDDSNLIIFGSSASHTYYLRGEDHYYTVSLSIPRIDPEGGQLIYSDPVYKKIKIEGDELEPVISYQFIEWNKVLFDATESKGQGIDWFKCRWSFGGGADQQVISFTEGESHSIHDKNDTSSESNTLQTVVYNAATNQVVEHYFKDPGSYLITLTIFRVDPVTRGNESASKSIVIDIVSDITMCPDQIVTIEAVYLSWGILPIGKRSCQVKLRTSPAGTSFFSSCRIPAWDNRDNSARMTCGNDGKWYVSEQKAWGYYANPYRDCVKRWPYDSFNDNFCWSCISSEVYDWL